MGARPSYGVRQHRERRAQFVRECRWCLAVFGLLAAIDLTTVVSSHDRRAWLDGLVLGLTVSLAVFTPIVVFLAASPRRLGTLAERRTGRMLRKHPAVLAAVSTVEFDGYDVDHVIVTGTGVTVVEVKDRSCGRKDGSITRDLSQLAAEIRKIRLLLRSNGIQDVPVRGLLAYWGAPTISRSALPPLLPE